MTDPGDGAGTSETSAVETVEHGSSVDFTRHDVPLFEFDPSPVAVINPAIYAPIPGFPHRAVISWFGDVVKQRTAGLRAVRDIVFEHGDHSIFVIEADSQSIAVVSSPVGAPAAAIALESLIACGASKIIGCGGAGIVRSGFDVGHVVVPTAAIRDEGTSYHYAPGGAAVGPHPQAVAAIDAVLTESGVPHDHGTTWTTDAFFRETPAKVARRREQGCIVVEMEASAMFAVATFRDVVYGQLLYAGDDVSAEEWDHRHWEKQSSARDRLFDLAIAAVLRL